MILLEVVLIAFLLFSFILSSISEYNVLLLEDACESMGCEYEGKKLGTFGEMSTFSTYFGHHISTIEGGFICTDNHELYEVLSYFERKSGCPVLINTSFNVRGEPIVCSPQDAYRCL